MCIIILCMKLRAAHANSPYIFLMVLNAGTVHTFGARIVVIIKFEKVYQYNYTIKLII